MSPSNHDLQNNLHTVDKEHTLWEL